MRRLGKTGKPAAASLASVGLVTASLLAFAPQAASAADNSLSTANTVGADATPPAPIEGQEVRIGTDLEDSVFVGIVGEEPTESTDVGVRSIPFNPIDSAQCDFANNADHIIVDDMYTYPYTNGSVTYWSGGDVDLLCGTDYTSGFKHIRARHQFDVGGINSWEDVRASASGALGYTSPQSWDEYMIHAVQDTFDYSYPSPQTIPGDKVCFAAPFNIYVGSQIYASYYANTIVSKTNYIIVTAYLSNNSQASACRQDY